MGTKYTIDEALNNLAYTAKLIGLKQKMSRDFIYHDNYLNYLLDQVEEEATHALIDKFMGNISEDFFNEYGE